MFNWANTKIVIKDATRLQHVAVDFSGPSLLQGNTFYKARPGFLWGLVIPRCKNAKSVVLKCIIAAIGSMAEYEIFHISSAKSCERVFSMYGQHFNELLAIQGEQTYLRNIRAMSWQKQKNWVFRRAWFLTFVPLVFRCPYVHKKSRYNWTGSTLARDTGMSTTRYGNNKMSDITTARHNRVRREVHDCALQFTAAQHTKIIKHFLGPAVKRQCHRKARPPLSPHKTKYLSTGTFDKPVPATTLARVHHPHLQSRNRSRRSYQH